MSTSNHSRRRLEALAQEYAMGGIISGLEWVCHDLGRTPSDREWRWVLEKYTRDNNFSAFLEVLKRRNAPLTQEEILRYNKLWEKTYIPTHNTQRHE